MKDILMLVNRKLLLQRIKTKFGTFTKFCRKTGFKYSDLMLIQRQLANGKPSEIRLLIKLQDVI